MRGYPHTLPLGLLMYKLRDALLLSHRDFTVSEFNYEVHLTRVLHTARISNVDSVMFVEKNKRGGKF